MAKRAEAPAPRAKAPQAYEPPPTLGACADELFTLREEKSRLAALVKAVEAKEAAVREKLIAELPKSDQEGAIGKLAKAVIKTDEVPQVEDWQAFYAYVGKKKRFDLLQKRLSDAAIREVWEDGQKVPGVGTFRVVKVSVTKR